MSIWQGDPWGGAWGHTWGGSWGLTWEAAQDEELRYYGSGKLKPYRERDPFSDATDADLEQLVRDKWELIERAQADTGIPASEEKQQVTRAPSIPASSSEHSGRAPNIVPSIIATHWPVAADEVAAAARIRAKQAREDEDLLLMLAELL